MRKEKEGRAQRSNFARQTCQEDTAHIVAFRGASMQAVLPPRPFVASGGDCLEVDEVAEDNAGVRRIHSLYGRSGA